MEELASLAAVAADLSFPWVASCDCAALLNASAVSRINPMPYLMLSPELRNSALPVADLLQLVEQRLIADLQFLRRPAAIPAGARKHLQNQFFFCFARGGARCLLQRNPLSISAVGARKKRA